MCSVDTQGNRIQILCFPMYGAVSRFLHFLTKNIFKCVMTNKIVWNERMSTIKHAHIISGKI